MARELHRRHPNLHAVAVHPGAVRGNLLRFVPLPWVIVRVFERLFYWDAATAALTVLRPLVDREIEPGSYLVPVARPTYPRTGPPTRSSACGSGRVPRCWSRTSGTRTGTIAMCVC